MKIKGAIFAVFLSFIALNANAEGCFFAKENGKIIKQEGSCDVRHAPFSSFKIAIALMGFDSGFLKSPEEPLLKFTKEADKALGNWQHPIRLIHSRDQTPATWMRYSVLWYSQEIMKHVGMDKFQEYVSKFSYGNADISGDKGKNNGLTNAWLGTSLKVSPIEQVAFLERLTNRELPVSKEAQERTIKLMALENIWDDWNLYGKTGSSGAMGWFVGWTEKDGRRIIFAQYVEPKDNLITAGGVAKELAKANLISLILRK